MSLLPNDPFDSAHFTSDDLQRLMIQRQDAMRFLAILDLANVPPLS